MRYLITTTDNNISDMERRLRADGKISPRQKVQAFPNQMVKGAYDLYLVDTDSPITDLSTRKPQKKPIRSVAAHKAPTKRAWYDNADLITAVIVAFLIGIVMKGYILN